MCERLAQRLGARAWVLDVKRGRSARLGDLDDRRSSSGPRLR
jgi:hypothetical protein